jgi:hypothetical protein
MATREISSGSTQSSAYSDIYVRAYQSTESKLPAAPRDKISTLMVHRNRIGEVIAHWRVSSHCPTISWTCATLVDTVTWLTGQLRPSVTRCFKLARQAAELHLPPTSPLFP